MTQIMFFKFYINQTIFVFIRLIVRLYRGLFFYHQKIYHINFLSHNIDHFEIKLQQTWLGKLMKNLMRNTYIHIYI